MSFLISESVDQFDCKWMRLIRLRYIHILVSLCFAFHDPFLLCLYYFPRCSLRSSSCCCCSDGWAGGYHSHHSSSIVLAETLFARQGIQVLCMLAWVLSGGNQNYGTNLRESFWSPGWIWVAGILMCQWCVNSYDTDGVATEDSLHATGGHWHTDLLLSQWNLSSSSPWIAASSSEFGSWKPTTDVEQVGKQFWAQAHHRSQIILFDIL